MAQKYVLNYFPLTGMAESIRLAFTVAGIEFTDNQIPFPEWPKYKANKEICPLGQVPTLQVDGVTLCQHTSIVRFLARELDMYGATNMQKAIVDQVIDTAAEIFQVLEDIMKEKPIEEQKQAFVEYYNSDAGNKRLLLLLNLFRKTKGRYFLGEKISMADLYWYPVAEYIVGCDLHAFDDFMELLSLKKRIEMREEIENFVSNRTQTLYIPTEFVLPVE